MSIKSDVTELNNLNVEIKRQCETLRRLRKRKKELEDNIVKYLEEKDQIGLKYQNTAVVVEHTHQRQGKKQKERESDAINILRQYGVENANSALKDLLEAYRGQQIDKVALKFKKLPK